MRAPISFSEESADGDPGKMAPADRPDDQISGMGFLLFQIPHSRPAPSMATNSQPISPILSYLTNIGAASRLTRLTTLIIGFNAGPAVSFRGSPTVSPTIEAWC